jgi:ADP-ribose pyrophosphatase YjhB (NUDIX family)
MNNDSEPTGVALLLVDGDGRLLLHLRDDKEGIPQPGVWAIPGGAIEPGESPLEAAKRELLEETGQSAEPLHFFSTVRWEGYRVVLYCAAARFDEREIVVGEGQGFRFYSAEEIESVPNVSPFAAPLLRAFRRSPLFEVCRRQAAWRRRR